jgi:hypothetical protein
MSTLSLDSSVSLFEPAPRLAPPPLAPAPARPRHGDDLLRTRHGRRAQPRARRASAASTLGGAALLLSGRMVAVRVLGTAAAAAAVTLALATKTPGGTQDLALLAGLSVRGLAAAAIVCTAWGFQDRARLGALATARAWYGTAVVLAAAHAAWFAATMPGGWRAHLATTAVTFALDAVLVAAPALLGARAGRPEAAATQHI